MKEKKLEARIFTIADWQKEEQYLRKRHKEGWKFVRVSLPGWYHFEKCTPEEVVYQLSKTAVGSIFRILAATVIFASPFLLCRQKRRFFATMNPGWI